jgi:hypothetical protein
MKTTRRNLGVALSDLEANCIIETTSPCFIPRESIAKAATQPGRREGP